MRTIAFATFGFVMLGVCGTSSLLDMSPPIEGLKETDFHDSFNEGRVGHPHEAIDIAMPRGTPVRAVVPGTIRKLFLSKPGGITIYQFDEAEQYLYYYAHLDRYAEGLREGMRVQRGEVIGFVGSTGNANEHDPHLHFAVFEPGPEKKWWKGEAVNPYPALILAIKRSQLERRLK